MASTGRYRARAPRRGKLVQTPVELSAYRIEILPLWAPWAPAVSPLGGGVPGINGAFAPYTGRRAIRRVTPCPTTAPAGIAAAAAASGAAADPPRPIVP